MLALAIDTATSATSVAVVSDDGRVRSHMQVVDARRHVETLSPLIREVLQDAGVEMTALDIVACGVGPGPFTGLRVGIATALAIGEGLDIPVVGVCSLDVVARMAVRDHGVPVTVLTRARRAEFCWAEYDERGLRSAGPLIKNEVDLAIDGLAVGDSGPVRHVMHPSAADLADLVLERLAAGERIPATVVLPEEDAGQSGTASARILQERARRGLLLLPPVPIYLRRPDAVVPASVMGGA